MDILWSNLKDSLSQHSTASESIKCFFGKLLDRSKDYHPWIRHGKVEREELKPTYFILSTQIICRSIPTGG